jgi:nitroreductase
VNFKELVLKNRSYRRFDQQATVLREALLDLVDLARQCGSAGNKQPLRYIVSCSEEMNRRIFPHLTWAAALKEWPGPEEGERPAAYIVIVAEKTIWNWASVDLGIAAQTILLGATEVGLGGCSIGVVNKEELTDLFKLPEELEIRVVIALGKPVETVVLEDAVADESTVYYRTDDQVHHVPKLRLEDVVIATHA